MDMDDVLVDISPSLYSTIRKKWLKYNKWFADLGPLTDIEVYSRPFFYVNEWLIKSVAKGLPPAAYTDLQIAINKELVKDFFSVDFYKTLSPTTLAKRTLMNKFYIDSPEVTKVYIITKYVDDAMIQYKKNFIEKYFKSNKIEVLLVPKGESKADLIKEKGIEWNLLIDDELSNIKDFSEKFNLTDKEFLLPRYGYNKMPAYLSILIKGKGGAFTYYDPTEK